MSNGLKCHGNEVGNMRETVYFARIVQMHCLSGTTKLHYLKIELISSDIQLTYKNVSGHPDAM